MLGFLILFLHKNLFLDCLSFIFKDSSHQQVVGKKHSLASPTKSPVRLIGVILSQMNCQGNTASQWENQTVLNTVSSVSLLKH